MKQHEPMAPLTHMLQASAVASQRLYRCLRYHQRRMCEWHGHEQTPYLDVTACMSVSPGFGCLSMAASCMRDQRKKSVDLLCGGATRRQQATWMLCCAQIKVITHRCCRRSR